MGGEGLLLFLRGQSSCGQCPINDYDIAEFSGVGPLTLHFTSLKRHVKFGFNRTQAGQLFVHVRVATRGNEEYI